MKNIHVFEINRLKSHRANVEGAIWDAKKIRDGTEPGTMAYPESALERSKINIYIERLRKKLNAIDLKIQNLKRG